MLVAGVSILLLIGGGTFVALAVGSHSHSSTSTAGTVDNSSDTSAQTPVPTQQADMGKVRQTYLSAMVPLNQAWINLDNAFKTAESKPCGQCPPGTFDVTPVIPKIEALVVAYQSSIDTLSILESDLEGQPSSDVGALINAERRALVAFRNELTGSANASLDDGLAGTLVQANKDAAALDDVVRKDIGLTAAAPLT